MSDIKSVIKRNKERVPFDQGKIVLAVSKAFSNVYPMKSKEELEGEARIAADGVIEEIKKAGQDQLTVEDIQNIVETTLMKINPPVAKAYILYRDKRGQIRKFKSSLGIGDDHLKIPLNSLMVLAARYLLKDATGKIVETPEQLFHRVASAIAKMEKKYGKSDEEMAKTEAEFYEAMTSFKFMPNSPTLMNAGTPMGQLSACFVLPVGDSIPEIYDAIKYQAMIHQSGGGTGFSFSRLRPSNDIVKSTGGVSSGPMAFMKVFNASTEQIKQGGKRRGANMGILRVDHPDILDFIVSKESESEMRNFNISVAITDEFMAALKNNTTYNLINPRSGKVTGKLNARAVWNLIVTMAWRTGDPGLIFIDKMNSSYANPVPSLGPIEATNPCGEVPLYPFDSCNLASINLACMVKRSDHHYEVDWDLLKQTTRMGVRFLDDVVDANKYPLQQIADVAYSIRRIGLGVMGWADMLIKLGIRYDSNEALALAEKVMSFISENGRMMSEELAVERGPFPEFKNSIWARLGNKPLRNSTITTVAPTGTISIISGGASQGIEPIFSVVYLRNVHESLGYNLVEVNNEFEAYALEQGFYSDELMQKLAGRLSIQDAEEVPEQIRKLFVTAYDIAPEWHVKTQAAFQKYTDNGVSKTVNFPNWATPQDIEKSYALAYQLGCKGITVYRDSSKSVQVLQAVDTHQSRLEDAKKKHEEGAKKAMETMTVAAVKESAQTYSLTAASAAPCPECGTGMVAASGCYTCPKCGYSKCA